MNMKRLMILLGILVFILLWAVISIYPNWLWFKNLDFAPIFWTMIWGKFGLATIIWILMIIMLFINLVNRYREIRAVYLTKKTTNTCIGFGDSRFSFFHFQYLFRTEGYAQDTSFAPLPIDGYFEFACFHGHGVHYNHKTINVKHSMVSYLKLVLGGS